MRLPVLQHTSVNDNIKIGSIYDYMWMVNIYVHQINNPGKIKSNSCNMGIMSCYLPLVDTIMSIDYRPIIRVYSL